MYICQTLKISWVRIMVRLITTLMNMSLPARLIQLRKDKSLTQQSMAEAMASMLIA